MILKEVWRTPGDRSPFFVFASNPFACFSWRTMISATYRIDLACSVVMELFPMTGRGELCVYGCMRVFFAAIEKVCHGSSCS